MGAGEGELGGRVVVPATGPPRCRMTRGAVRREGEGDVWRHDRAVVIRAMARHAGGRLPVVDTVGVAIGAARGDVGAGQRETAGVMVEGGARPRGRRVTAGAGRWELGRPVIRCRHPIVVALVAGHAGRGLAAPDAIAMALRAREW